MAIAIGALVGFAVRFAGNGHARVYGIIGATVHGLGCLGGEILSTLIWRRLRPAKLVVLDALDVDLSPDDPDIFTKMDPISYLIYGIGIFEGYKLSIVK